MGIYSENKQEINDCLRRICSNRSEVSWDAFVVAMQESMIALYNGIPLARYKESWKQALKLATRELEFSIDEKARQDSWNALVERKIQPLPKQSVPARASTSSNQYQRKIAEIDMESIALAHSQIENKWKLKSGRLVEEIMYSTCMSCHVEHPMHSLILDVDDAIYKTMLTDKELEEVKDKAANTLCDPLPANLQEIMMKLDRKKTALSMYDAISEVEAHPFRDIDEYWLKQSILNYVLLFAEETQLVKQETEQDLLDDVYGFIKKSCKLSGTKAYGAKQSKASSEASNRTRSLASNSLAQRQPCADNADLTFEYNGYELFCLEIGLEDKGANGTKELNERGLRSPKMMKNFCCRLAKNLNVSPEKIKITNIIISGMSITAQVMSFENGSISLLSRSPRLQMPSSVKEIPRLLPPVLSLIYNLNQVVLSTINVIDDVCSSVMVRPSEDVFFFPCFVPNSANSKKRRVADSEV
ncbi:hypothetical protein BD560DRAFT_373425 [Blakeslea trispora]|nr:hypothetical protein BD560DRAFT_483945 [Blakeslea trispora]KAI8364086.1 hypothetical protein BD560DRAFT_373425 [Blakeslea trispora]